MNNLNDYSKLLLDDRTEERFNRLLCTALKKQRLNIDRRLSADYCSITDGEHALSFDTSSFKYSYAKTLSQDVIGEFVDKVILDFEILERMVSFTNGQEFLRFSLINSTEINDSMIYDDFIGDMKRVICYSSDNITARHLDISYLEKWDVPREVVFSVADRNMCRMLQKTEYTKTELPAGRTTVSCLEFKSKGSDLLAALMSCSDFWDYIAPMLSQKFLAAAPTRDNMILLGAVNRSVLGSLGKAVSKEYSWAARPLSADVLLFSSAGVEIAGNFKKEVL
ncbi:MAG: hypothetical protein LIO69_08665 [Oscillospiraceae bacterium]|nr:hypothetical protein [Oscillospiraceae bacterium]